MLRKSDNVFAVIISKYDASTIPADGTVVTNDNLEEGGVCFVDAGGRRETYADVATGDQYAIVQSLGPNKPLMRSPMITKGKETVTVQKHVAAVQQVTAIGFNGTTGSLPSANSTDYWIRIRKNDNDGANNSQPNSMFAGPVKTDASATQEELAFELVKNGIKNFDLEPDPYLFFEALSDEAGAALTGTAANLIFTKGSKTVTGDAENKTITNLSVGDLLKISTAKTNGVYKVTAVANLGGGAGTTPTITLNYPYQEATATVARGTCARITAADAAASEMGVRMTGIESAFDVASFRNYYVNRFTATFSDTSTTVTALTGANTGSGTWQQVAMDEYMNWGFEGQGALGTPPITRESTVKIPGVGGIAADGTTARYSTFNIAWTEDINDGLTSTGSSRGNVVVHLNLKANGTLDADAYTGKILANAMTTLTGGAAAFNV